jgi:hypothetical protein
MEQLLARIKHRMKENGIKMYGKFGCVLWIETVTCFPPAGIEWRSGDRATASPDFCGGCMRTV